MQYQAIEQARSLLEGADQVMTTAGAAEYLGFSIRTLQAWRAERKGPAYCRPSGAVRYLKADLIRWLASFVWRLGLRKRWALEWE
jgi:Helix-turn-helix domain